MMEYGEESTEDLLQMLSNAYKTFGDCAGRSKADMNQGLIDDYRCELHSREVKIPHNDILYNQGFFNGKGTY